MRIVFKLIILIFVLCVGCKEKVIDEEQTIVKEGAKNTISPFLFGQNLWLTQRKGSRPGYIQESLWEKV